MASLDAPLHPVLHTCTHITVRVALVEARGLEFSAASLALTCLISLAALVGHGRGQSRQDVEWQQRVVAVRVIPGVLHLHVQLAVSSAALPHLRVKGGRPACDSTDTAGPVLCNLVSVWMLG